MSFVDRKADIVVIEIELSIATNANILAITVFAAISRWSKEGISTFGAEEVLLVISPFAESRVVQGYKPLVNNWGTTMVTPRRELLLLYDRVRVNIGIRIRNNRKRTSW